MVKKIIKAYDCQNCSVMILAGSDSRSKGLSLNKLPLKLGSEISVLLFD